MKKTLFLLGVLVGLGMAAAYASVMLWRDSTKSPVAITPAASLTDEEKARLDAYKERLDFYGKRADDLERLLSLLLAGSTIYALAVGYNAYQQAKDAKEKLDGLQKTAQSEVDKFRKDVDEQSKKIADLVSKSAAPIQELISNSDERIKRMESQIARNFPLFVDTDFALSTITHSILHMLPDLDVVDGKFRQLSSQQIQQLLFYEKAMSTFEFFNTESLKSEISGMFHGLGNFYALKFKATERQQSGANQPVAQAPGLDEQDRERARFYLDFAIRKDSKNMAALNDRGYFKLEIDRSPNSEEAAKDFFASLEADDGQQRARYNLALIEHRAKNYQRSVDIIEVALKKTRWQKGPRPERIPDLWYNRACSLAGLAGTKPEPERTRLLESALNDLEQVANAENGSWELLHKALEDDLKTKGEGKQAHGDLILLLEPQHTTRVQSVKHKLEEKMKAA